MRIDKGFFSKLHGDEGWLCVAEWTHFFDLELWTVMVE